MKKNKIKNINKLALFTLPVLIPLTIFWVIPLFSSFFVSLTNWDYISDSFDFVGFKNYSRLFQEKEFYKALKNTFYFSLGTIFPTITFGLLIAIILKKKMKASGFYKALIFSPWITPTVAISIVWSWFFESNNGLINHILNIFNLPSLKWLHSPQWAMLAVIIVTVWKGIGWTMIFYLGALEKVPISLYEAAKVDGASEFKQFIKITLPLISPTTFFLIIINLINSIQAYDQIQILTQGGPSGSTRTLLYLYYQKAFENFDMGSATAVSIVILLITVSISSINYVVSKKWVYY